METIGHIVAQYKRMRTMRGLNQIYTKQYALVGLGHHCINNLLPVIQYLQLPLKYICCTSDKKAQLISQKYKEVKGTTSLQDILQDDTVDGVFVATRPHEHFRIATEVIKAGKSLFIEKPPCDNETELKALTDTIRLFGAAPIIVGLQRRFAPATRILQKRLTNDCTHHYHYRYLTGLYPEGDALTDLFIHPLDYVTFLFGPAKIKSLDSMDSRNGAKTLLLILQHRDTTGMIELSTDYSWQYAEEQLSISTDKGLYILNGMEKLDFYAKRTAIMGIPTEKIWPKRTTVVHLYGRNHFAPTIENNPVFSQGFFSEIRIFAEMVEGRYEDDNTFGIESTKEVYSLMAEIKRYENNK